MYRISAVTLIIKNMKRSCNFYSKIPGFRLAYGGSSNDSFTTFEIGGDMPKMYLNLELATNHKSENDISAKYFWRVIFHTDNVDKLYSYFKGNVEISKVIQFENEPTDAPWGERYFHIFEPDGYQLSFAEPLKEK
ncbi:MAG TPA: VOC family protein [Nitrososphaeraceae archaeon]|nr:VOC family protein [Nitrososphaeraceae archaeon]